MKRSRPNIEQNEFDEQQVEQQSFPLPRNVLVLIANLLDDNTMFSLAMSCKAGRSIQQEVRPNRSCPYTGERRKKLIRIRKAKRHENSAIGGLSLYDARDIGPVTGDWIRWAFEVMGKHQVRWRLSQQCDSSPTSSYTSTTYCREKLILLACLNDHLTELKWLKSKGLQWTFNDDPCFFAAYGGHWSVLEWLRDEDACPCGPGWSSVLEWARTESNKKKGSKDP